MYFLLSSLLNKYINVRSSSIILNLMLQTQCKLNICQQTFYNYYML